MTRAATKLSCRIEAEYRNRRADSRRQWRRDRMKNALGSFDAFRYRTPSAGRAIFRVVWPSPRHISAYKL